MTPLLLSDGPQTPPAGRHTPGLPPAPTVPDPAAPPGAPAGRVPVSRLDTDEARELSRALFARLRRLDEGSAEHAYVRNTLVELNLALVRYAASRLRSRGHAAEDVEQVGVIGLIKAINRYDPDRGVRFVTFALPTISGEIKRYFRDTGWAVHVPRRLQELRAELAKATADLEQRLGRSPTVAELAERVGRDREEVLEGLAAANSYTATSFDFHTSAADDSALAGRLGYEDADLERVENLQALRRLIADLPERDREILSMRFGEEMTQREIGEKLGVSQMHVSRLLSKILGRLRGRMLAAH